MGSDASIGGFPRRLIGQRSGVPAPRSEATSMRLAFRHRGPARALAFVADRAGNGVTEIVEKHAMVPWRIIALIGRAAKPSRVILE